MVAAADDRSRDEEVAVIERSACPTCGSCSGMFTANSMNCLTEALGLALPGNGTVLATHADRKRLFVEAGHLIVDLARRWYEQDDASVLPRTIASFKAFENAMTLDIAMGGSTNTVLHLLAAAHEGEVDFTMADIDRLSRRVPVPVQGRALGGRRAYRRCASRRRHHGDPGRARPRRADPPRRAHRPCARPWPRRWSAGTSSRKRRRGGAATSIRAAPGGVPTQVAFSQDARWDELDLDRERRRDPRRRACLLPGRRPGRAVRQSRRGRLHREDRRRRRGDPDLLRPGADLRKPGRRGRRHPRRQGQGRRRGA